MLPEVMEIVAGRLFPRRLAVLRGHRRRVLRGLVYPGVLPSATEDTAGVLWEELDRAALARIDRFEGEAYARQSLEISLVGGAAREAFVYVLRPERHALASDATWDEAEFRARHLTAYLAACRAFAREEP